MTFATVPTLPISAEAFRPFGTLLASDGRRRTEFPAAITQGAGAGRHSLSVIRFEPLMPETLIVDRLERHPFSAQTFIPLSVGRFYALVAPSGADGSPVMTGARAFAAGPGDAIVYPANAWHASLLVLDQVADMAVVMWRRDARDDTVQFDLRSPVRLAI